MLTDRDLPAHLTFVIEHNVHVPAETPRTAAIVEVGPRNWVDPDQLEKSMRTGSIWIARWIEPDAPVLHIRAAADLPALLADIAPVSCETPQASQPKPLPGDSAIR